MDLLDGQPGQPAEGVVVDAPVLVLDLSEATFFASAAFAVLVDAR
ncbi:hypothetical protein [Amycolatopsis sp. NPDC051903]